MPSSRETNTMAEGLRRVLNEITSMKTMPDGDLAFLVELETQILQYLRTPTSQSQMSGMQGPGGDMGGMGGMGPSAQGGMGSPVAQYPSAPMGTPAGGGIAAPNIDPGELQRMIAGM